MSSRNFVSNNPLILSPIRFPDYILLLLVCLPGCVARTGADVDPRAESLAAAYVDSMLRAESLEAVRREDSIWRADSLLEARERMRAKQAPGPISRYDQYFRLYAREISWDWRMLAALCYHESHFNNDVVSPRGARGLMQLIPSTAARYGLTDENAEDPEANIEAGVQFIKSLKMIFHDVPDESERTCFVLAAYNAGPAHVLDAMNLARAGGVNPFVWMNGVEDYLLLLNDSRYYTDPACRYGRYNGRTTARYVRTVMATYERYCQMAQ